MTHNLRKISFFGKLANFLKNGPLSGMDLYDNNCSHRPGLRDKINRKPVSRADDHIWAYQL